MKIKTADLIGPALDWVLLSIENPDDYFSLIRNEGKLEIWADCNIGTAHPDMSSDGKPRFIRCSDGAWVSLFGCPIEFLNWGECGPIIEREGLMVGPSAGHRPVGVQWTAIKMGVLPEKGCCINGSTPLIAAMRCYVASKLGDEVDVPEQLK